MLSVAWMFFLAEMRKRTTATGCKMTTNVPAQSTQYKPSLGQNRASRKRSGSKVFHVKCQSVLNVLLVLYSHSKQKNTKGCCRPSMFLLVAAVSRYLVG